MDMHIGSINVSIRSLALSFHLQSFAILASKCQAELIWGCKTVPRLLSVGCILFSPGPPTSKRHPVCNNFPDIFLQHPQKTNITRRSLYYSVTCPWSLSPESFWHFTLSWCDMHWSAAPSVSYLNRREYFHCTPHLKLPHFYENLRCLQGNFPLSSCQVARHKTVITKQECFQKKIFAVVKLSWDFQFFIYVCWWYEIIIIIVVITLCQWMPAWLGLLTFRDGLRV